MLDLSRIADSGLVARIDYHESIGSTNDRALELASQGETALPLLVVAEQQTAGRGRGTNRWLTTDGALTFSLALEAPPNLLPLDQWPQIALAAGIAVCDALRAQLPTADIRVKWPNDVFLAGRKVAGILSESIPGWRDRLIVGIGINVNNSITAGCSPADLSTTATSLIGHDELPRDRTDVLISVLDQFDRRWRELLYESFASLAAEYRARCFLTGKAVTIQSAEGKSAVGMCRSIDDFGRLRLSTAQGERSVVSGTILHWDG